MTKNFLTRFVPLEVTRDDKIKNLQRDLIGVVAIKKDCRVVENDLEPSRVLVEFGVVGGDATTINRDGEFSPNFGVTGGGGGYSPNVGGDFGGVDGGGGGEGFSSINEEVRFPPEETPFTRGESSTVGVGISKEPSCFCKCLKCTEKIDSLILKVQSLEDTVKVLISKRGVNPSSKISDLYTLDVVKRRKRQISKALTSAKKKAKNTPRVMVDDQIQRQHVDVYKRINSQKMRDIKEMLKHKSEIKELYTMHSFNYVDFDIMLDMDKWWEDYDVYKMLFDKSLIAGAVPWRECIDSFVFDNFYLGYCRGEKSFPGGVPWHDAKRIFSVMNLEKKHFVAIEILLSEGKICI
ncbi:hypothetical protein HAX54_045519 [Datura stramonium]|uniref:Uncharacterized protein n=1 Tax=Datura stramonium TaxID=4076 RepID=A0ABS8WJU3_DATST|nr:hypothetical protein [Datura stramonium]